MRCNIHPSRRRISVMLGVLLAGFFVSASLQAEERPKPSSPVADRVSVPVLEHVSKIWESRQHSAFTDLIRWQNAFWCVFREAEGHVGGDGEIYILRSADGHSWEKVAVLKEPRIDLRDPKLSITPDNLLMVTMGGSVYLGTRQLKSRQPRVAFSVDGRSWTGTVPVLAEGDWLWRVTWHQQKAYGVSYRTAPKTQVTPGPGSGQKWLATLYESENGLTWTALADFEIDGRPNEATIRFAGSEMQILIRREAGDRQAWFGTAKPPYRDWSWTPTGHRMGGPNFINLKPHGRWAVCRHYPGGAKTVLFRLNGRQAQPTLTFPSGGDTSYAGLVWHEDQLWVSYYASHEGHADIYLGRVSFRQEQRAKAAK